MQRDREEGGQREGGRREGERGEAGSRALVNNPPLYVISRRRCTFRAAIGRPRSPGPGRGRGRAREGRLFMCRGGNPTPKRRGLGHAFFPLLINWGGGKEGEERLAFLYPGQAIPPICNADKSLLENF